MDENAKYMKISHDVVLLFPECMNCTRLADMTERLNTLEAKVRMCLYSSVWQKISRSCWRRRWGVGSPRRDEEAVLSVQPAGTAGSAGVHQEGT